MTSSGLRSNGRRAETHTSVTTQQRPRWLRRRLTTLVVLDGVAAIIATLASQLLAFGFAHAELVIRGTDVPYAAAMLAVVPTWICVLATSGGYDIGPFGEPTSTTRRVVNAGTHFLALMAVAYYLVHLEQLGRDFMIAIAPLATGFTLAGRAIGRTGLRVQRGRGHSTRHAVVVGPSSSSRPLLSHLGHHPEAGVVPVAALFPADDLIDVNSLEVPVVGTPDDLFATLASTQADLVLLTGNLRPGELRDLTWKLEGRGVDVLVAPTVTQMAAYFDVRPVAGLPLLYVDQ